MDEADDKDLLDEIPWRFAWPPQKKRSCLSGEGAPLSYMNTRLGPPRSLYRLWGRGREKDWLEVGVEKVIYSQGKMAREKKKSLKAG